MSSIHSGSRGFTPARQAVIVGFAWVHSGAPRDRRVHLGSREFTQARPQVAGLIRFNLAWVYSGAPSGGRVHSGSRGFLRFASRVRRVHSCSHGFTSAKLAVVGLFRVRLG